jgi:hypothetical protein
MTEDSRDPSVLIADGMARFRREMEENDRVALAISLRTKRMLQAVLAFLAVMALAVVVQIWSMRADLMALVGIMDGMFTDFQGMAADMEAMTGTVAAIQSRVADLPSVATDLTEIHAAVGQMDGATGTMNLNVTALSSELSRLRATTAEMTGHFQEVQRVVGGMGYDVEQMLRPLSVLPR